MNIEQTLARMNNEYREKLVGEQVHCFECGGKIVLNTEAKRDLYNSSGMCNTCEQKALGESDPVMAMLENIQDRLTKIEIELYRQGGRS